MKRLTCLIGVSLMLCVGQQSDRGLLAIPDKIIEVGLPVQLSVHPVYRSHSLYDDDKGFRWLHGGRYLAYAVDERGSGTTRPCTLYLYDTRSGRNTKLTEREASHFLFTERNVYYLIEEIRPLEQARTTTVYQYNPTTGRARALFSDTSPQPEEPVSPPIVWETRFAVSPSERLMLVNLDNEPVLVEIATGRTQSLPNRGEFQPTGFIDDATLLGTVPTVHEGQLVYRGAGLHLPTGEVVLDVVVPKSPAPRQPENLSLKIEKGALYLISNTSKSDAYRSVFLTRDYRALPATPVMAGEGDFIPPEPAPLASIAPDENGLAIVTIHGQLFYVPLTKRDPGPLTEAIACGKEVDREALAEQLFGNARLVATAMMMYVVDYDEHFPPASEDIERLLNPYLKNEHVFKNPLTGGSVFSYLLNGEYLGNIESPVTTQMGVFDWGDPNWVIILYADGHVKKVPRGSR